MTGRLQAVRAAILAVAACALTAFATLPVAAELDTLMAPEVDGIQGTHIAFRDLLHEFYARRAFRPAWGDAGNAADLRRAVADSAADGLNPADYFLPLLAQRDILRTEALLRLGYHLSFGKVDPESFDARWNSQHWYSTSRTSGTHSRSRR